MSAKTLADTTTELKVRHVVASIRNLPTPPIVFTQIQKVLNKETASAENVANILAEDPSMSAKVLKLTNSAFYGLAREIDSVKQAVIIVGMDAIKNLVLSASVLGMFKGNSLSKEFQDRFWRHSLATGQGSRLLAKKFRAKGIIDSESAFSAGLLHDIGKLVIACFMQDDFEKILKRTRQAPILEDYQIEEEILGFNHSHVGSALAANWNLPSTLADAITFHHRPEEAPDDSPLAAIICGANYIAKQTFASDYEGRLIHPVSAEALERLGADEADLHGMDETLREEYAKAETFMAMASV